MKKNRICIYMTALSLLLCPMQARAEGGDGFRLDSSGLVTLDSSHAAKEGISSVSFSLTVEAEDGAEVDFVFQGDAEIVECRYHAEENLLNIYMAGTTPLFQEGALSLPVGKVVVSDKNGGNGKATVGVEPDSLTYVYGSSLRSMEDVGIPEKVRIGGEDIPAPTQTPPPTEGPATEAPPSTQAPAPTQRPGQQPSGDAPISPGTPTDSWQTAEPAPTGAPLAVVPRPVAPAGTARPTARPTDRPQESGSEQTEDLYELTPRPLEPEGASPEPDDSGEEPVGGPGSGGQSEKGGFLEEAKLILAGLAIAAVVAGGGAAVIVYLIKKPKDR